MKILTLCLVVANSQVLLGFKKRGFGVNRWNGFGGKVNEGETIETAAARELHEECGIVANGLKQKGLLHFRFENDPVELEVHVFEVTDFEGEPSESEEMRPQWFYFNEVPYDKMWADDKLWLPLFLEGKKFEGSFLFKNHHILIDSKIETKD
jgi:8-oxo-dGTP diphosphatase/2-hydroxy-dATP diphosphatase